MAKQVNLGLDWCDVTSNKLSLLVVLLHSPLLRYEGEDVVVKPIVLID